jgi:hypothetical protein
MGNCEVVIVSLLKFMPISDSFTYKSHRTPKCFTSVLLSMLSKNQSHKQYMRMIIYNNKMDYKNILKTIRREFDVLEHAYSQHYYLYITNKPLKTPAYATPFTVTQGTPSYFVYEITKPDNSILASGDKLFRVLSETKMFLVQDMHDLLKEVGINLTVQIDEQKCSLLQFVLLLVNGFSKAPIKQKPQLFIKNLDLSIEQAQLQIYDCMKPLQEYVTCDIRSINQVLEFIDEDGFFLKEMQKQHEINEYSNAQEILDLHMKIKNIICTKLIPELNELEKKNKTINETNKLIEIDNEDKNNTFKKQQKFYEEQIVKLLVFIQLFFKRTIHISHAQGIATFEPFTFSSKDQYDNFMFTFCTRKRKA